jgi:hypothetical protein
VEVCTSRLLIDSMPGAKCHEATQMPLERLRATGATARLKHFLRVRLSARRMLGDKP